MRGRRFFILAAVILVAAGGFIFLPVRHWFASLERSVQSLGSLGPITLALGYMLATVFLIPGSAITVSAAGLFGFKTAFLAVLVGANAGALCAFLLARTLLRDRVARWADSHPKFCSLDRAIARQGFKMVLLLRLSPAFPFTLLNYLLGLTAVRTASYMFANLIGMLPGMILYIYIGSAARDVISGDLVDAASFYQQILKYTGLLATAAVAVSATRMARTALREAEETQERGRL